MRKLTEDERNFFVRLLIKHKNNMSREDFEEKVKSLFESDKSVINILNDNYGKNIHIIPIILELEILSKSDAKILDEFVRILNLEYLRFNVRTKMILLMLKENNCM